MICSRADFHRRQSDLHAKFQTIPPRIAGPRSVCLVLGVANGRPQFSGNVVYLGQSISRRVIGTLGRARPTLRPFPSIPLLSKSNKRSILIWHPEDQKCNPLPGRSAQPARSSATLPFSRRSQNSSTVKPAFAKFLKFFRASLRKQVISSKPAAPNLSKRPALR